MGWLQMSPHLLKTFVKNRVAEINELTGEALWLHIDSQNNPADLVSRGVNINVLKDHNLWWHGPENFHSCHWSHTIQLIPVCENFPELKKNIVSTLCTGTQTLFDFERFSSFIKLKRAIAYVLRFIYNARNKQMQRTGYLSVTELNESLFVLTRFAQIQSFPALHSCLSNKELLKNCKEANKVLGLNVFLDDEKLIRIGGRLCNSLHLIILNGTLYYCVVKVDSLRFYFNTNI
jgi:hypothetical protein